MKVSERGSSREGPIGSTTNDSPTSTVVAPQAVSTTANVPEGPLANREGATFRRISVTVPSDPPNQVQRKADEKRMDRGARNDQKSAIDWQRPPELQAQQIETKSDRPRAGDQESSGRPICRSKR